MAITVSGTALTFNDNTVQTTRGGLIAGPTFSATSVTNFNLNLTTLPYALSYFELYGTMSTASGPAEFNINPWNGSATPASTTSVAMRANGSTAVSNTTVAGTPNGIAFSSSYVVLRRFAIKALKVNGSWHFRTVGFDGSGLAIIDGTWVWTSSNQTLGSINFSYSATMSSLSGQLYYAKV